MPQITFHPDLRSIDVREGERLLTAAWKAGVGIKSVCGGHGKCGSCLVEVDAAASAAGALLPPTAAEIELLPPDYGARGYRLACLCDVHGDLALSVPPESQAVRNSPRKPYTVTDVTPRPIVTRVCAPVAGAYEEPLRPLAERLSTAFSQALERKSVELPVGVVADYSTSPGFDGAAEVTATLYAERIVLSLQTGRSSALYGLACRPVQRYLAEYASSAR